MDIEDLRVTVYDDFRLGVVPTVRMLGADLSLPPDEVAAGLRSLAAQRHLVLGA